jgi:hypothetical protein
LVLLYLSLGRSQGEEQKETNCEEMTETMHPN